MATIAKLDAARRQLLAAIHLHWFFIEPIAVYQLATNASEICDAILKKSGGTRIKQHVEKPLTDRPSEIASPMHSKAALTIH
ncbi:hypothetical protein [Rhizobium leguminosarum]|uniref:hypothetical protein n=1 Tax=Rhizobium leguminosarum TaxID=384 RepID=UPI003F9D26E9